MHLLAILALNPKPVLVQAFKKTVPIISLSKDDTTFSSKLFSGVLKNSYLSTTNLSHPRANPRVGSTLKRPPLPFQSSFKCSKTAISDQYYRYKTAINQSSSPLGNNRRQPPVSVPTNPGNVVGIDIFKDSHAVSWQPRPFPDLRLLPLGTPFTEADFIKHGILSADPIKPFLFKSMLPDMETGNVLTNRELSSALTVAFSRCRRTDPVDLLFFDTCYNGAVEVYAEVRRYAHAFVASSLRLPKTGWDYQDFLKNTRTPRLGQARYSFVQSRLSDPRLRRPFFHRIAHHVARLSERVPLLGAELGVVSFLRHIWDSEILFNLAETQNANG